MAVAEPSFSSVMDSTSSSFKSTIRARLISNPSKMMSGVFRSVRVLSCRFERVGRLAVPRIWTSGRRLGSDPYWLFASKLNDGSMLAIDVSRFLLPNSFSSLFVMVATAPVNASLFFWKIPVTTMSFIVVLDCIDRLRTTAVVPGSMVMLTGFMPTYEKRTMVRLVGMSM